MTKRAGKKKPERTTADTTSKDVSQSGSHSSSTDIEPNSFFWPELSAKKRQKAIDTGRGDDIKQLDDFRLELRSVNERWPVPQALRERMVYEAARVLIDSTAAVKEKLLADKLLHAMDRDNHAVRDLPDQIQVNVSNNVNVESPANSEFQKPTQNLSVQDVIRDVLKNKQVVDALDFRVVKSDYAD